MNLVEAHIIAEVSKYPYTLSFRILNGLKYYSCCNESILVNEFNVKMLSEFLEVSVTKEEIELLEKQKIEKKDNEIKIKIEKSLDDYFIKNMSKKDRNIVIINAYLDGHTQVDIANYLKVSKSLRFNPWGVNFIFKSY